MEEFASRRGLLFMEEFASRRGLLFMKEFASFASRSKLFHEE